jgi:acyl-CoA synthetase (NDP forming)
MSVACAPAPPRDAANLRPADVARARAILAAARHAGRTGLLEPEGLALLEAAGIATPRHALVPFGGTIRESDLAALAGDRVVVKVVGPAIAHKTDLGGVAFVARDGAAIDREIAAMAARLADHELTGFLVAELVDHDPGLAGELLVALRATPDFGPVVVVGAGGVHAELLARDLRPGRELAVVATDTADRREIEAALRAATVVRLATEPQRGRAPLFPMARLVAVVERLLELGRALVPDELAELEINPLAVTRDGLVALDVLARLAPAAGTEAKPSPVRARASAAKLDRLLQPRSIAIAGVSGGENVGRTILRNILRDGFDAAAITIVKPGATEIDGCRCVPDVASLPDPVDLFVVAVSATVAAQLVPDVIERDAAGSIIVIPGGFEETAGGRGHAARIRAALAAARARPGGGPLINGGNCLGIRSTPGHYDTLFIPEAKLAGPSGHPAPLVLVAQSGAFAITRLSRLEGLDPKYVITVGNQLDLTVGDHLEHLASDADIRVFGVYVEGFAPGDGLRFLRAARAIRARGGIVVLYRAGRTKAGARASASHTAAIAGDALVTAALARSAGVVVADTLAAFDDLLGAFTRLDGRTVGGNRVGAMTNAGFECVAIADAQDGLEMATFDTRTEVALASVLAGHGLGGVVDVHNPFDLTPMGDDCAFAEVAEAILASETVDIGLIGNVPFTARLRTLPVEDDAGPGSVAARLVELWGRTTKAWVAVVDAGSRYDRLARTLGAAGIPVFRTVDAAMRTLGAVVELATHRDT